MFDPTAATLGAFINKNSGVVTTGYAQYGYTDYIPVVAGEKYYIGARADNTTNADGILQYDLTKTWVSGTQVSALGGVYTVPSGISYIRCNFKVDKLDTLQIEQGSTATAYTPYNPLCGCHGTVMPYRNATGTVAQAGQPEPNHPVYPVFFRQGRMELRKINDTYVDTYDASTGKITRNVGVKVLDGTENWQIYTSWSANSFYLRNFLPSRTGGSLCTHYVYNSTWGAAVNNTIYIDASWLIITDKRFSTTTAWEQWLAEQYAAGTPVTIWYPLKTPVEETWSATSFCETGIVVATTNYNTAKFRGVVRALENAVSTINTIVTSTIAQATSIGAISAEKQTRPADDYTDSANTENCPQYRQCLLVEDESGISHWYEINDPFYNFFRPIMANNLAGASGSSTNGYYQLEYIESTGTQYIDTGVKPDSNFSYEIKFSGYTVPTSSSAERIMFGETANDWTTMIGINQSKTSTRSNIIPYIKYDGVACSLAQQTNGTLKLTPAGLYFDGDLVYSKSPSSFGTETYSIYLFAVNRRGTASSSATGISSNFTQYRLENFKAWNNNTLVRDMVPVVNTSNGKYGMYDKVHGVFYPNAGSGDDFTPGPIVENDAGVPRRVWQATWAANATYNLDGGQVHGETLCNNVDAGYFEIATAQQMNSANWGKIGNACWCRMTGITVNNVFNTYDTVKWVSNPVNSGQNCLTACTCYRRAYSHENMRNSMYYEWK